MRRLAFIRAAREYVVKELGIPKGYFRLRYHGTDGKLKETPEAHRVRVHSDRQAFDPFDLYLDRTAEMIGEDE